MSGGGRALLHTLRIWGAGSSRQISQHGVGVSVTSSSISMRFESIRPFSNVIPTPAFFGPGPGLPKPSSRLLGVTTGTGARGSFQFQPTRCYSDKTPKGLVKSSELPDSVCESCGGAVNRGKGHLGSSKKEALNSEVTKDEQEKCVLPLHENEEFKIIDMRELLHGAGEKISSEDDDLPPFVGDKFKNAFHKGTELLVGALCFVLVSAGYLVLVCGVALVCMLPFLLFSWLLDECGFGFVLFLFVYALLMIG